MNSSFQLQAPALLEGFPDLFRTYNAQQPSSMLDKYIMQKATASMTPPEMQNIFDMQIPNNEEMYQQMGGHLTAPEELEQYFQQAAAETGVDIRVLKAIAKQESNFNPRVRSKAGAMGVMQLMPGTAKELGVSNPFDPQQNILGGARYFKKMLNQFGNIDLALAAYNAGPGNVRKYGGIPPFRETQTYVRKIRNGYAVNNALKQMQYVK